MNKFAWIISGILLVIIITVSTGLRFCYNRVIALESSDKLIRQELVDLTQSLEAEIERNNNIDAATVRLVKNDEQRQEQFYKFYQTLDALKADNEEVRAAMAFVIPRMALTGLRSFGGAAEDKSGNGGAGAGTHDQTNGNTRHR